MLSLYRRFESAIAAVLTAVIALVVVVALYRLTASVVSGLVMGALDPLDPAVFQTVFGEVLTVMIALEFNHTLELAAARKASIIQTKVVVLIAILALARKFIVLDPAGTPPGQLLGLAAMAVALGIVYWLMRERDDRAAGREAPSPVEEGREAP